MPAQAAGTTRADKMLANERETLEKLRSQEGRAMEAQKRSETQLNSMIKDMA